MNKEIVRIFFWVLVIFIFLSSPAFLLPYDDTDDIPKKARSGLSLYTDHGTGVQYVKAGLFGGITPRIDKDGKPIVAQK